MTTAWTFDAVGFMPLGSGFELFGRAGVALWESEASASGTGGGGAFSDSADDDGSDFHFGVGASYAFTDNFRIRAEWERITDDDLDAWTVSAVLGF
ncbi:MAG: outer membrane beta-barrel protein [Gammaproteobacteria bacterium]